MKRKMAIAVIAVAAVLGYAITVFAAQDETVTKTTGGVVNGEISGITKKFISVVYKKDAETNTDYEMLILIDENVRLDHKKSLSELNVGDSVSIEYEDATVEDSAKRQKLRRTAKVISFVKSAPPAPPIPQE